MADLPDDIVAQVILGEAAGEGPKGMTFVGEVMRTRAKRQKKSLEQIVSAPQQFSAFSRPDLAEFASRQPIALQQLAHYLVEDLRRADYTPQYPEVEHYVTADLWNRREELPKRHWVHKMRPVATIGNHVALREAK